MVDSVPAVVAITDQRWFSHFRPSDRVTEVDEVNFWRPAEQREFRALREGEPFFFRLKAPYNAIAGFGFFAVSSRMTVQLAWEIFGDRNGDATQVDFERRISEYRSRLSSGLNAPLSCLVLRDAVFLPQDRWLTWGRDEEWSQNLQTYKRYDLATAPGQSLGAMLRSAHPDLVPDLQPTFDPLTG